MPDAAIPAIVDRRDFGVLCEFLHAARGVPVSARLKGVLVSPTGAGENPRLVRKATLILVSADEGSWQLDTTLPDGRYRFVCVRDYNGNINQWPVRQTYAVNTEEVVANGG